MPGLVPGIHVLVSTLKKDVDGRDKPGRDDAAVKPSDAALPPPDALELHLKPERARTVSATAEFHPRALPGLHLAVTYFDIDYRDRVVAPLQLAPRSFLSNPLLARYIQFAPSAADQAAIIARDPDGLGNGIGVTYDPGKVVAIADIDRPYQGLVKVEPTGFNFAIRTLHSFAQQ